MDWFRSMVGLENDRRSGRMTKGKRTEGEVREE